MPLDFTPYLPKQVSPLDVTNSLMQRDLVAGELQKNQLALRQAQAVDTQRQGFREAVQSGTLDLNNPTHQTQALAQFPDVAPAVVDQITKRADVASQKRLRDAQAGEAATKDQAAKIELASRDWAGVNPNDDEGLVQVLEKHVRNGFLDKDEAVKLAENLPPAGTPERMDWYYKQGLKGLSMEQQAKQASEAQQEAGRNARNDATLKNQVLTTGMSNATSIKTTGMREAGENARQGQTIANQRLLAGMNPDGSMRSVVGPDGQIDLKTVAPEDLAAAYRYKTDGTFPPNMGRGVQGAAEGRKIRAIATALDSQAGESPEDARTRQLATKGDITAINQMRKREVAVGANVKNFDFNADQVLQLSGKVDRTGVPIANAWINAGRRAVTGNPDLSAFDTAVKTTVNEFAQIVSGTTAGATTEGEKKKAETLLNAQQTPEQIIATINQMRVESQNRMQSFKAQRAESMPTNVRGGLTNPEAPPSKAIPFGSLK